MFAGIVALLGLLGAGIKWAAGWGERRAMSRASKLQAWHEELAEREKALHEGQTTYTRTLEARIGKIEADEEARKDLDEARDGQMRALRIAFDLVSSALRVLDPANVALTNAQQVLAAAFPVELAADGDMIGSLRMLEAVPSSPPRRKKP